MKWNFALAPAAALLLSSCATGIGSAGAEAARPVRPLIDYHKHLISSAAARGAYPLPVSEISLPPELKELLDRRQVAWNEPKSLEPLYTVDAVVLNTEDEDLQTWIRGRAAVARYVGTLFGRPHRIKPVAYSVADSHGYIAGYLYRPDSDRYFGHVLLSLARSADGRWQIEAETPTFPGPRSLTEVDAKAVVDQLDEAGIQKAVVLSVAYWFGSDFRGLDGEEEYALVRAENDWVAAQVARYPDRLIGACSVNPLARYALQEVRRCGQQGKHRALKLHLGNSRVDLRKAEHAQALGQIFAEADRQKLAIIIHLWTDPSYETEGAAHAQALLDRVLPWAPHVPIQIAHMAGGGRATQPALKVLADAIATGDPRTRNVYFDVATLVDGETPENLRLDVERMRQIGLRRILFGSDTGVRSQQSWASLHALLLTEQEFRQIAQNQAPYAR